MIPSAVTSTTTIDQTGTQEKLVPLKRTHAGSSSDESSRRKSSLRVACLFFFLGLRNGRCVTIVQCSVGDRCQHKGQGALHNGQDRWVKICKNESQIANSVMSHLMTFNRRWHFWPLFYYTNIYNIELTFGNSPLAVNNFSPIILMIVMGCYLCSTIRFTHSVPYSISIWVKFYHSTF